MTDIIIFCDNNGKLDVYTGGNINGTNRYLEIIVYLNKLTTPVQRYHNFVP